MQRKGPLPGKIFARCILRRRFAGLFGYMARTSCQSQLVLDAWRANLATKPPPFLVRGPFWDTWSEKIATDCRSGTHQGAILPSPGARERISRVFAISERPQRHSAMCLNVLRRSPIDARAERPAHALRARCSCPRAARHSAAMPCAVRGAFVAAEKVSCGLRVSMR